MNNRFSKAVYELVPHRPPMLLINDVISVDQYSSQANVFIDKDAPFYEANKGVPTWIGLEYMGQTAALIAGYQLKHGLTEPHRGFLLGTRHYEVDTGYFADKTVLVVTCQEKAFVGDSLANFDCSICYDGQSNVLARANLSVFRQPESITLMD